MTKTSPILEANDPRILNSRLGHKYGPGLWSKRRCIYCGIRPPEVSRRGQIQETCPGPTEGVFEDELNRQGAA